MTKGTVLMRATAHQNYGGRAVRAGEVFTARDERDAKDLVALGFAQVVDADGKPVRGAYNRRDMQARKT